MHIPLPFNGNYSEGNRKSVRLIASIQKCNEEKEIANLHLHLTAFDGHEVGIVLRIIYLFVIINKTNHLIEHEFCALGDLRLIRFSSRFHARCHVHLPKLDIETSIDGHSPYHRRDSNGARWDLRQRQPRVQSRLRDGNEHEERQSEGHDTHEGTDQLSISCLFLPSCYSHCECPWRWCRCCSDGGIHSPQEHQTRTYTRHRWSPPEIYYFRQTTISIW